MRPQQQNRRMRGRGGGGGNNNNNNNRKGPNPLTRSYESNGPDVKIRGTAQQIADKYTTLARDAQSSGDRVIAENYLQHAEHYNRIIAAAQAQLQPQQNTRDSRDENDDDLDERDEREERDERDEQERPRHQSGGQQRQRFNDGSGPQPVIDGMPAEIALNERQGGNRNGARPNGGGGHQANGEAGSSKAEAPQAPAKDASEEAPKPPRRTRRPRKSEEAAEAGDEARAEEAAAQS